MSVILAAALGSAAHAQSTEVHVALDTNGLTAPGVIADPASCLGPLSEVVFEFSISNTREAAVDVVLTLNLPAALQSVPNSCTVNVGTCVVTPSQIQYAGSVGPGETAVVRFATRVGAQVPEGAELCSLLVASFGGDPPFTVEVCVTTNSARQCGLGAPALATPGQALLAAALLLGGVVLVRRRRPLFSRS